MQVEDLVQRWARIEEKLPPLVFLGHSLDDLDDGVGVHSTNANDQSVLEAFQYGPHTASRPGDCQQWRWVGGWARMPHY